MISTMISTSQTLSYNGRYLGSQLLPHLSSCLSSDGAFLRFYFVYLLLLPFFFLPLHFIILIEPQQHTCLLLSRAVSWCLVLPLRTRPWRAVHRNTHQQTQHPRPVWISPLVASVVGRPMVRDGPSPRRMIWSWEYLPDPLNGREKQPGNQLLSRSPANRMVVACPFGSNRWKFHYESCRAGIQLRKSGASTAISSPPRSSGSIPRLKTWHAWILRSARLSISLIGQKRRLRSISPVMKIKQMITTYTYFL